MSSTLVTVTAPTTRTDGSALALTDIASVTLSKAVGAGASAVVATFGSAAGAAGPVAASMQYTDPNPDLGQTDNYSATVTDAEGNVSAAGTASVSPPASQLAPPSAPGVTAVFQP